MQLYNDLKIRFEQPLWALNPELALFDVLFEKNPDFVTLVSGDVLKGLKLSNFGRKDNPTVEQILRAAIFKEIKQLDYRELEIAMYENLTLKLFMKLDGRLPFSFTTLQKYISKISEKSLRKIIIRINNEAITANVDTIEALSPDTTVVETNVHYPTNNSLIMDCIKIASRLLTQYKQEKNEKKNADNEEDDRLKRAKKLNFDINNTKSKEQQKTLFDSYLKIADEFKAEILLVILREAQHKTKIINQLAALIPVFTRVYDNAYKYQILGEKVENKDKIFSVSELHTDIIVKGQREVEFGHKVLINRGKSNLIFDFETLEGNPKDSTLYQQSVDRVIVAHSIIPHDTSSDGGFASADNLTYSRSRGIVNTVFTKVTKNMTNIVESKEVERQLKRWRGTTEAVISNLKRGFGLQRVLWEGFERFKAKVAWSVLCYNLRVFAKALI